MRVYGASFWFILPTETHLAALAASCPPVCVAEQSETTCERQKKYGKCTMVLEVHNIQ